MTDDIEALVKRLEDVAYSIPPDMTIPVPIPILREAATALRSLKTERDALSREHGELVMSNDSLKAERDEAHDEMGSMDAAIVDLRSRLTALEGALRDAEARLATDEQLLVEVVSWAEEWEPAALFADDPSWIVRANDRNCVPSPKSEVATSGRNESNMTTSDMDSDVDPIQMTHYGDGMGCCGKLHQ